MLSTNKGLVAWSTEPFATFQKTMTLVRVGSDDQDIDVPHLVRAIEYPLRSIPMPKIVRPKLTSADLAPPSFMSGQFSAIQEHYFWTYYTCAPLWQEPPVFPSVNSFQSKSIVKFCLDRQAPKEL